MYYYKGLPLVLSGVTYSHLICKQQNSSELKRFHTAGWLHGLFWGII